MIEDRPQPDEKRLTQVRLLTELSRALTYAASLDEVLQLVVERAASILQSTKVALLLAKDDGLLSLRASLGIDQATEPFRGPPDEIFMERLQELLKVAPERFMGVPLVVAGKVTGVLAVALPSGGTRTSYEEWILSALADQAAVALEKTRLDHTAAFRERLIGIVSHDLRNPLNAILLGVSVLEEEDLSEFAKKTIKRIRSNGERAGRMIRDLLDYTQAHLGGEIPMRKEKVALLKIVQEAVEEMSALNPSRRILLAAKGETFGEWDVDRMTQVVSNLLSNSLQYGSADFPIDVEVWGDHNSVTLAVHNQGPAIPSDQLLRIFEPMHRAATGLNTGFQSVGLGLYIVRHVVKAHGGSVRVASGETGTTFTIVLPR